MVVRHPSAFMGRRRRNIAKDFRVNEGIRIPEVRVVDDQGQQLGVIPTREALALARERDLDLVEVSPNAVPPVCRVLDYGKFRYIQTIKAKEMRKSNKANALREVRFRPRIGRHDIESKERLVHRLLGEGSKVKVSVMFRGREREHPEVAMNLLREVAETLKEESKLEQAPNLEGRMMSIVLAPAKALVGAETKEAPESGEDAETKNA